MIDPTQPLSAGEPCFRFTTEPLDSGEPCIRFHENSAMLPGSWALKIDGEIEFVSDGAANQGSEVEK